MFTIKTDEETLTFDNTEAFLTAYMTELNSSLNGEITDIVSDEPDIAAWWDEKKYKSHGRSSWGTILGIKKIFAQRKPDNYIITDFDIIELDETFLETPELRVITYFTTFDPETGLLTPKAYELPITPKWINEIFSKYFPDLPEAERITMLEDTNIDDKDSLLKREIIDYIKTSELITLYKEEIGILIKDFDEYFGLQPGQAIEFDKLNPEEFFFNLEETIHRLGYSPTEALTYAINSESRVYRQLPLKDWQAHLKEKNPELSDFYWANQPYVYEELDNQHPCKYTKSLENTKAEMLYGYIELTPDASANNINKTDLVAQLECLSLKCNYPKGVLDEFLLYEESTYFTEEEWPNLNKFLKEYYKVLPSNIEATSLVVPIKTDVNNYLNYLYTKERYISRLKSRRMAMAIEIEYPKNAYIGFKKQEDSVSPAFLTEFNFKLPTEAKYAYKSTKDIPNPVFSVTPEQLERIKEKAIPFTFGLGGEARKHEHIREEYYSR